MHHTNNYNSIYPDYVPPIVPPPAPPLPAPLLSHKERKAMRRKERAKHKGRWTAPLVFAFFLLLIGGTAAVLLALNYSGSSTAGGLFRDPFTPPGYDDYYDDDYDADDNTAETTIERSPNVPGIGISLHEAGSDELSFQAIYEKCIPSIVSVLTTADDGGGSGTGVILTEDGYLVTNYHVIQGGSSVEILLHDGKSYEAKLVGGDQTQDLAVLKIDAKGLTPAEFGNSDVLRVGDLAFAIGNPLGEELRGTMTDGIISAIDRDVHIDGNVMTLLQTSAALNPGNSGGALINRYGQVVGITNMKMMSYFETIEGLGFAIPSVTAKSAVEALISTGYIAGRPTLGFTGYSLSKSAAKEIKLVPGVYVQSVEKKSDAYTQGLQRGDVVTECEGKTVASVEEVNAIKAGFKPGDTLAFKIYRDGKYLDMDIKLMERYQLDY